MELDADTLLKNAIMDGLREAVKSRFTSSYGNPTAAPIEAAIKAHEPALRKILDDAIAGCLTDPAFREQIATAVRHSLAKTLVSRFGGELEKQVNVLKSDPATRARITLAIEEIVRERSAATA